MATDYSKLDAAILAAIAEKAPASFTALCVNDAVWARALDAANARRSDWPGRCIDRRLQALRKAGRIRYQRKPEGWVLVTKGG